MRVAVFTSQFPGRTTTFFVRDLESLAARGIEIDVYPLYPEDPGLWKYVSADASGRPFARERTHFVSWRPRLGRRGGPRLDVPGFWKEALKAAGESIPHGPVVAAKTAYAAAKAWNWAQEAPAPYDHVLGYWGNYAATAAYLFRSLRGESEPFSIFLHAGTDLYRETPFLRQKLRDASRIIVCTEFNREFLRRKFPDLAEALEPKIHVHQHGLDFADLPFGAGRRVAGRVVGVGSFERAKGFDDLVRSCARLRSEGFPVELELVGDGPERTALERLADSLSVRDAVCFRGWLSFAEAREAIQSAEILAHPSIGLGDGAPNVIKEAMALGTPVVASRVAGIPALLEDGACGVLVPPRDPDALARALRGLSEQDALRKALSERARRSAEARFDIWRNGRRLAEALGLALSDAAAR